MAYPNTTWPTTYDVTQTRIDNVDIVWASEYHYHDEILRTIEEWLGTTGKMLGEEAAGAGPAGAVSPSPSGPAAVGFKIAMRANFTDGELFSIEDNFDVSPQQKASIDYAGRLWTADGIDLAGTAEFLRPPIGGTLPATFDQGRVFYKTGAAEGLYAADGSSWGSLSGGVPVSSIFLGGPYPYTQAATPVEEVAGEGVVDGALIGSNTAYFKATVVNTWQFTGVGETTRIRLYDMGPAAGPPATPRLVAELTFAAQGGPRAAEQALTVVSAAPTTNQILDQNRVYETVVFQDPSTSGDVAYMGSTGVEVR